MRYFMTKSSVQYKEAWDDIEDYIDSYKKVIKDREQNRLPFFHRSPQYAYRPHLVEFLKTICIEKKLSHCCLHLAVYLLDIFMDNHSIIPEKILLLTNVCLLLAAKLEENNMNTPKITELNEAINNRYQIESYKSYEFVILHFFNWYIMYATVPHYVYYYIQLAICEEDIKLKGNSLRSIFYNLHECISDYLDQIIENVHYMQFYSPSKLAAGIIAVSRMEVGLSCWTKQLEDITDYKKEDIEMEIFILKTRNPAINCQKCKPI